MFDLERALEWLRPLLVASETWDYCVVWKLSVDGVSRSIEWMNCCCVGATDGGSCINSPTGDVSEEGFPALCRDTFIPHSATSKSCLALAQLPFSITLQSCVYEQVIVSSQPSWINSPDKLSPKSSQETTGTRVLIPVQGGLVELFSTKQISEDQGIMGFVTAHFDVSSNVTFTDYKELFLGDCTNDWTQYFQQSDLKPLMSDFLLFPKLEGSSSGSIPSCIAPASLAQNSREISSLEGAKDGNSGLDTFVTGEDISNESHREDGQQTNEEGEEDEGQQFKSKNLISERKRREKVKRGLWELRSLVPKITKMSQGAVLGDAIDHIVETKTKVKNLQEELEELERDGCKSKLCASNETAPAPVAGKFHQVQVEVNQLTRREFLIRILCKAEFGAFTMLLEILDFLGLQVTHVNFTSCKGMVSNSFMVQANNGGVQAEKLRDALINLTCG